MSDDKKICITIIVGFFISFSIISLLFMYSEWDTLYPSFDKLNVGDFFIACLISMMGAIIVLLISTWLELLD